MKRKASVHLISRSDEKSQVDAIDVIERPSVITSLHVCDRETSTVAGSPRAWRKLSEIEQAYRQERLGAVDSGEARDRRDAGVFYANLFDTAQKPGRDSTQAFDFRGAGQGVPLTEASRAAIARLVAIEMRLGRVDKIIIRGVCATGLTPAEAVGAALPRINARVTERLCEALDALQDAIECTERRGRRL